MRVSANDIHAEVALFESVTGQRAAPRKLVEGKESNAALEKLGLAISKTAVDAAKDGDSDVGTMLQMLSAAVMRASQGDVAGAAKAIGQAGQWVQGMAGGDAAPAAADDGGEMHDPNPPADDGEPTNEEILRCFGLKEDMQTAAFAERIMLRESASKKAEPAIAPAAKTESALTEAFVGGGQDFADALNNTKVKASLQHGAVVLDFAGTGIKVNLAPNWRWGGFGSISGLLKESINALDEADGKCGDQMVTNPKTGNKVKASSLPPEERKKFMVRCQVNKGVAKKADKDDFSKRHKAAVNQSDKERVDRQSKDLHDKIKSNPELLARARKEFGGGK